MNSKTQSLNEQIIAVMNSGNFIAPPALKKAEAKSENPRSLIFELLSGRGTGMEELMNEHMVAVASLSDYGKAIYTLHEQKNALLKEKAGKLQENMTSNEPEVSSHEFGGFGIMLSISMGGGRRNLIDFVTKDHQADDQLGFRVNDHMVPVTALLGIGGVVGVTVLVFFSPQRTRPRRAGSAGDERVGRCCRGSVQPVGRNVG